jgi:hypothetical protein
MVSRESSYESPRLRVSLKIEADILRYSFEDFRTKSLANTQDLDDLPSLHMKFFAQKSSYENPRTRHLLKIDGSFTLKLWIRASNSERVEIDNAALGVIKRSSLGIARVGISEIRTLLNGRHENRMN